MGLADLSTLTNLAYLASMASLVWLTSSRERVVGGQIFFFFFKELGWGYDTIRSISVA